MFGWLMRLVAALLVPDGALRTRAFLCLGDLRALARRLDPTWESRWADTGAPPMWWVR